MTKENANSKIEEKGLRLLENLLEESHLIKTYFKRNDKSPLYDGHFNLTDENGTILKQFDVQIKSTGTLKPLKIGPNKGKIKFDLDINVLDSVRTKVTENPTFYFVIDVNNKMVFYKLLTFDFLIKLGFTDKKSKGVACYFDDSDILRDVSIFNAELLSIYQKRAEEIVFKSKEEVAAIQYCMDKFYTKTSQINFIVNEIWPNLWKFGLRLSSSINMEFKEVKTGKIIGSKCSAFAIYPILVGEIKSQMLNYSKSPENLFVSFDYTGDCTPEKYLDGCLQKIVDFYFNKQIYYVKYLPDVCLREIVFSFLDQVSEFDKTLSSKTHYKTFYLDDIALSDVKKVLNPYFQAANLIINGNLNGADNKTIAFFISASFGNGKVIINKKLVEKTILANETLSILIERGIGSIRRVWKYMVPKRELVLAHYKSDLFDKKCFCSAVDYFFKNIKDIAKQAVDNLPIKINKKINGFYHYELIHSNLPFPNYSIRMALFSDNSDLIFEKIHISDDDVYRFSMWSAYIEDLFDDGMPFYNVCKITMQKLICDKLLIDEVGIIINNQKIKFFI